MSSSTKSSGLWSEWLSAAHHFGGGAFGWQLLIGRVQIDVRPDMEPGRWYWSVFWPRRTHRPEANPDGSVVVGYQEPQRSAWGKVADPEQGKLAAQAAYEKGRPG